MNIINKQTLGILFLGGIIGLFLSCSKTKSSQREKPEPAANLLPAPQKIESKKPLSLDPNRIETIYLYSKAGDDGRFAARLLEAKIDSLFHHSPNVQVIDSYKHISRPAILLGIPSVDQGFANFSSGLPSPRGGTNESYVLDIGEDAVTVSGGGNPGLFYGVQTLMQLLEEAKWAREPLAGQLIRDWPDVKFRAVHFDAKHHLDRYEYLKEAITKLAKYKINNVIFEFEDKFQYASHPVIAAPNAFTPAQIKALTEYAHNYHINIIPLVQSPGHAGFILKHDKYKSLRADPESNWTLDPFKEQTYELIFDLYDETIKATPGVKYFHVGGDEISGGIPRLEKYIETHGHFDLYLTWLNKVHDYLQKQGRTMIFWDGLSQKQTVGWGFVQHNNMPEQQLDSIWNQEITKLDSIIDKYPRDAIYIHWNYGLATKGMGRIIDWYNQKGLDQIVGTGAQNRRPLIPSYDNKPANIKSFITQGAKKHVFGEFTTAWDDSGVHFETFWMGFLASAEYGWSSKGPESLDRYWAKYIRRFFGPNTVGLDEAFHNLSDRVAFWNKAFMQKGKKYEFYEKENQLIELPDFQNQKPKVSSHFRALMQTASQEKEKCNRALETLKKNMNRVTQNAYNLKVFASMARFMKAHADLVIAVGNIARYRDQALVADSKTQPDKVYTNVNNMAATADSAWNAYKERYEQLKQVWEISRYPKGGKNVIPNRYGHFASRREDLSYLIAAEEQMGWPDYARKLRRLAEHYKQYEDFTSNQRQ